MFDIDTSKINAPKPHKRDSMGADMGKKPDMNF